MQLVLRPPFVNGSPEFGGLFFSFFGFDTAYFIICYHANQIGNMFWAKPEFKIIGPVVRYDGFGFTQREQLIYWWCIRCSAHIILLVSLLLSVAISLIPAASSLRPLLPDRGQATPGVN